jgi:hypothetical protein
MLQIFSVSSSLFRQLAVQGKRRRQQQQPFQLSEPSSSLCVLLQSPGIKNFSK